MQNGVGHLFCQAIRILMGTNCAPSLLSPFFYFLDDMIRCSQRKLGSSFNLKSLCFRYIYEQFIGSKKFFRPSRGSGGMLPRKILKR